MSAQELTLGAGGNCGFGIAIRDSWLVARAPKDEIWPNSRELPLKNGFHCRIWWVKCRMSSDGKSTVDKLALNS